jgi:hypothetical protein
MKVANQKFHIYVEVLKEKAGCASAYSVSKMLEKTSGVSFPQQNRRKVSVNIFILTFPPTKSFRPAASQVHLNSTLWIFICGDT